MRNLNGKNYVTPVKAQEFGDCWSFSLASAAEISYLYANDMGVPAGEKTIKSISPKNTIPGIFFTG